MKEDAEAHAIIGGNKQGKSSLVVELIENTYDLRSQKVVILNNSNPKAFQKFTFASSPDFFKKKWHGIVRYHNPEGFKQTLKDVYEAADAKLLKNGAVVFDDCTKYIDSNVPDTVKNFLVDRRMVQLDLFFTTHALAFLPPFCRRMSNTITVFKTAENFEKPHEIKSLLYPNYLALFEAWTEVMATPKKEKSYIQPFLTIETGI